MIRRTPAETGIAIITAAVILLTLGMSGCAGPGKATSQALPTVVLDSGPTSTGVTSTQAAGMTGGGGVSASGILVPEQIAQMSFSTGANILKINVRNGDFVRSGQVLAQLSGKEKFEAAVKAAELAVLTAEKALQDLKDEAEQARADAQLKLADALDKVDQAEKHQSWKDYQVGDRNQIDLARAKYILADNALKEAEDLYSTLADSPEDNVNRAQALSALANARIARDKALANLNYLLAKPDEIEVGKADAELEVAQAERDAAQREYDRWKDGPDKEVLALAVAQVENARAQLLASQVALAGLEVTAPFDGTISNLSVHAGEWVAPGQTILVVADLSNLRVETTDLSERDVMKIEAGQETSVFIKALGEEVSGKVSEVSPLANTIGGDVVYKTAILLDSQPAGMRPGMSVDVQFITE